MSQLVSTAPAATRPTQRAPWTVKVLSTIVLLLSIVTSYGAIYFTFYFESPDPGVGSYVFAATFIAINITAASAAIGLLRGQSLAWQVLLGYGVLGILWCIAKLVFWQEVESLIFGVATLAFLLLLGAPRTREHVS